MFGPRLPLMLKCSLCLEKENENSKCGSDISPGSTVCGAAFRAEPQQQHYFNKNVPLRIIGIKL